MKLRNKKTGEKAEVEINCNSMLVTYEDGRIEQYYFDSLKDLEEWEDYEEPKEHWYIDWDGKLMVSVDEEGWEAAISIGNYFETKEEAEKAVEKLKALKRLKDKGFRFTEITKTSLDMDCVEFKIGKDFWEEQEIRNSELNKDLHLLFGGEE